MRVVSLSKVIPFDGIPHAGGEYVRRHVDALREQGHEVTIIAPRDERNIRALTRMRHDVTAILLGPERRTLTARVSDRLFTEAHPASMPPRFGRALRNHDDALAALRDAELVEVQWTEMMTVFADAASAATASPPLLVAHDVLAQRERRALDSTPRWQVLLRAHRTRRLRRVLRDEAPLLRQARAVVTLSEKDAALVRERVGAGTAVCELAPPLWDSARDSTRAPFTGPEVIMVGAFNRPENHSGAMWMLRHVWPHVLTARPDARLTLVGSRPSRELARRVGSADGVALSGYVDSLEPFYETASVAVVPLLSGAGIKFKTIDALVRGVPVVSTSVGAEGITDAGGRHPFEVHDDPERFAEAVVNALNGDHTETAARASAWARERYGTARFAREIRCLLRSLAPGAAYGDAASTPPHNKEAS